MFFINTTDKNMKKFIAFLMLFFIWMNTFSQQKNDEAKHALRTSSTTFGLSTLNLTDNYISPLPYSGIGLRVATENGRLYSPDFENFSIANKFKLDLGTTVNPAVTASVMYFGVNFAWGAHYHFRPAANLQILTGNLWDVDFGFKFNTRNVNNPFNIDLSTNLNLSAIVIYEVSARKRILRLQAAFQSPWIGCMFAPEQGASYYEIFSLGASGNFTHFSSFHNKLALYQTYSAEIPFANSFWRVGFAGESLKYTANNLIFEKNNFNLFLGYTYIFSRFTRNKPAPVNFIGY